jgi:N6-adenosine-specific RNA methylase IME4
MNELQKEDWYQILIDDCKSIITEAVFTSKWALVEGYWHLGERIREDINLKKWEQKKAGPVLQGLAKALKISERTIYYAVAVYDKYRELGNLPEGKNITWNKLITKYLPVPKESKPDIPLPPPGKFAVIIIDPPWPYGTEYDPETRRVASPYPEMEIENISKIEIPGADISVIWLWTTHRFLQDAFSLMNLWNYEYKITACWNKEKMGMGAWLRCQMEFCLLGIRGKPNWNLTNQTDFISESRREHSRKPDNIYKMAEELFPGPKDETFYLDYFSREKREGWAQTGNELQKF